MCMCVCLCACMHTHTCTNTAFPPAMLVVSNSILGLQQISTVQRLAKFALCWRIEDQLHVTSYFISLLMCSTCFGHYYIHHQELATTLLNYHIGRIVLGSMCVGDSVWLGWSGFHVAGWSLHHAKFSCRLSSVLSRAGLSGAPAS